MYGIAADVVLSIIVGYVLGSLNPAALISKLKKKNLRAHGTGNLGATNTMLVLGNGYGALVLLLDIAKAFLAVRLAQKMFASLAIAGLLAGSGAVLGHIYPFYLKFKGGKGLAAFGGMILGLDPLLFAVLLAIALILMLIINYSAAMPVSAAILFPIIYAVRTGDAVSFFIATAVSILIIVKHFGNIEKAICGSDRKVREYIKKHLIH